VRDCVGMVVPYLPDEVIGMIVSHTDDGLNLRYVNKMFFNEVDVMMYKNYEQKLCDRQRAFLMYKNYEQRLCDIRRACRISTYKVPKKWLMRYTYKQHKNTNV